MTEVCAKLACGEGNKIEVGSKGLTKDGVRISYCTCMWAKTDRGASVVSLVSMSVVVLAVTVIGRVGVLVGVDVANVCISAGGSGLVTMKELS